MAKFILIDHSITGYGGHYFEYAKNVLDSAKNKGYETFLATNKKLDDSSQAYHKIIPVFEYDIWGMVPGSNDIKDNSMESSKHNPKIIQSVINKVQMYFLVRRKYSWLGYIYELRHKKIIDIYSYLKNSFNYAGLITTFALPFILFVRILKAIEHDEDGQRKLGNSGLSEFYFRQQIVNSFYKGICSLFRKVKLAEGDIVFIPTLSEDDLEGLICYLRRKGKHSKASWNLVFRRNIFRGREPEYRSQMRNIKSLKISIKKLKAYDCDSKVFFYCDTDKLIEQYNRINEVSFSLVPIPVNKCFSEKNYMMSSDFSTLRLVYAGDARYEKGYHFLPSIAKKFQKRLDEGEIIFDIQSNFNFRSPDADIESFEAREELEKMEHKNIILRKKPMDSEEYVKFIKCANILLLLYHRNNYYARSSGILVEALCAGVPVVVPSGSWLADQILLEDYLYFDELRNSCTNISVLQASEVFPQNDNLFTAYDNSLIFSNDRKAKVSIKKPDNSDILFISFSLDEYNAEGTYVRVEINEFDEENKFIKARKFDLTKINGFTECICASALEIKSTTIEVVLFNAYVNEVKNITKLRFEFSRSGLEKIPLAALGVSYTSPEEIPFLIENIVECYEQYKRRVDRFSVSWKEKHSTDKLIDILASNQVNKQKGKDKNV